MTIRFLKPWNGYQPDAVVSGLTNEAALIAGGLASDDLDGGNDGRTYEAKLATDASGNVTGLVGPDGSLTTLMQTFIASPKKTAFWGDSRFNGFNGSTVEVSGTGTSQLSVRSPFWCCAFMGDAEFSYSFAVSGDTASAWQSASRTNGKTFDALSRTDAEIVFIQYGVNDAIAGTAAATIAGYLQNLILEIVKYGKYVVFESIYPVASPASNYAAAQVIIDAVNAQMATWIASLPGKVVYADTATTFKAGGTYASSTYIAAADGLHQTRFGAYTSGKMLAAAAATLYPKKQARYYTPLPAAPNLLNLSGSFPIATQFNAPNQGTATVVQSSGVDSDGVYYQWLVTPNTFGTTYQEQVLQLSVNLQTANPPYHALAGNEVIQGGARVVVDDGAGGAPNAYSVTVRQRFFTGSIYSDTGSTGAPAATDSNYSEKVDIQVLTPKLNNTTASAVASPAMSSGLTLQILADSQVLGTQYRVRVYNPELRRVDYVKSALTAASFLIPTSGSAYTNNSQGKQQICVGGGTVTVLALNGVTTGLTSGTFTLNAGDTLTPTYSVAPTWTVTQV